MDEFEISAEVLEEKSEKINKRFRSTFKSPWHIRGFFVFSFCLVSLWSILAFFELIVQLVFKIPVFKKKSNNKGLKPFYTFLIPFCYLIGCFSGILYPNFAIVIFDKIERFFSFVKNEPFKFIQQFFNRYFI